MSNYQAILFDFDGVLLDSEPIHWRAWCDVLSPLGFQLPWERYRDNCIGVADEAMFPLFAACCQPRTTLEQIRAAFPRKKQRFGELVRHDATASSSTLLRDLLKSLHQFKLAVVTSSSRYEVEPLLEDLQILKYFQAVVYGEDVERRKPAPDPYLLAAHRLGITSALVVEDSEAGVASGTAAGFDVLYIPEQRLLAKLLSEKLDLPYPGSHGASQ